MNFFQETTEWVTATPNHIYLLNDSKDKMYAYVVQGTNTVREFKTPIRFDARRRRFVAVKNQWNYVIPKEKPKQSSSIWTVAGSKGNSYTVEMVGQQLVCSCPGFKYRSKCRHVEEISGKLVA
jgi:hypothetical protein